MKNDFDEFCDEYYDIRLMSKEVDPQKCHGARWHAKATVVRKDTNEVVIGGRLSRIPTKAR
jgi:hypothetical protein